MKPPFAELNLDSAVRFDPPPEGPPAETSLALLQAVYRDPTMPLTTRMRAATVAIAYEHPKLSIGVRADHHGMGKAIDAARAKHVAEQSAAVANRERERSSGERPVATFRRVAERAMSTGNEADIGPLLPRRKPG
jgi:hypothetical protein